MLDISLGKPAAGVPVMLEIAIEETGWRVIGQGLTDSDGRLRLADDAVLATGTYRLTFRVSVYFAAQQRESFYPEVSVIFLVKDATQHYHVPLLLSPFGYSTYRGS